MGDALDFDTEANKLANGTKAPKKRVKKLRAEGKAPAKTVTRKKRTPKTLAYIVLAAGPADALDHAPPAGVQGPFTDLEEMIAHMHSNAVAEGDTVVVFREVRRGPVKTKTWIG